MSTATSYTYVSTPFSEEVHAPDGVKYLSTDDFCSRHDKQMNPPKQGWVHGSRVMCAMRKKSTNEYFPRVLCYVHREGNEIFLIQKCCVGSMPQCWPSQFDRREYTSWTIRDGRRVYMESECVAYLGPCEGRNAL